MTMPLPWSDVNSDPLQDIKDFLAAERAKPYYYNPVYGRTRMSKGVAIVSGGLDSTTMIYHLLAGGHELRLLSFDYGQRHGRKELKAAMNTANQLGLQWDLVNLRGMTHLIDNSALTSAKSTPGNPAHKYDGRGNEIGVHKDIEVPDGHYAEENMKATVVPNRNMIMLSIAAGVAVNEKLNFIATGVHSGDHFIYPDCRPQFLHSCGMAIWDGNEGLHNFNYDAFGGPIRAPFIEKTKADIAYHAMELNVPIHLTWSCYKGGEKHCGKCGTCVERLEAIDEAIRRHIAEGSSHYYEDMTEYEDTEYWRQAVREARQNG